MPLFIMYLCMRMFNIVMLMCNLPDSGAYAILAHYLLHALSNLEHGVLLQIGNPGLHIASR